MLADQVIPYCLPIPKLPCQVTTALFDGTLFPPARAPIHDSAARPKARALTAPQDGELAGRAQQGDHRAFGELVRRHQDRIFRFILRLTGSREEAMDLTQDTFMKAWQALAGWRADAPFHSWLYRIAHNAAMDLLRRRQALVFEPLDEDIVVPDEGPTPDEQLHTRQRYALLEAALQRLPVAHREILLLREIDGLSYAEISLVLDIGEGTVKSRIARARAALLDIFERASR